MSLRRWLRGNDASRAKAVPWVIGGLLLLAVTYAFTGSKGTDDKAQSFSAACDRTAQQMAHNVAKQELQKRIAGQLEFTFVPDRVSMRSTDDGCRVELTAHFEGQNAFGGPVRRAYSATIVVGGGSRYRVEDISIDE